MDTLRLIAILGGSGSGKSELGLKLAQKFKCDIFSLDSLAIYQDFDIVSAKPSHDELQQIHHYGINILKPSENNNAILFKTLLLDAIAQSQDKGNSVLLIVGGSSFYLKSIIEGLSPHPTLNQEKSQEIKQRIDAISNPYDFLQKIDPQYSVHPSDTYRLNKALEIYFSTLTPPSQFFLTHPREAFPYPIEKYAIQLDRKILKDRIIKRTQTMLYKGLLQEIEAIFETYDYSIQPSNAIGVKECIEYLTQTPLEVLQGKPSRSNPIIAQNLDELHNLISTHTIQLAKRQMTFNRTQFGKILPQSSPKRMLPKGIIWGSSEELWNIIS